MYYGFYSEEAAKRWGTSIWTNEDGELVQVTMVCGEGCPDWYKWEDKEYVGIVVGFLCEGHGPTLFDDLDDDDIPISQKTKLALRKRGR